ncbi:aldehyde dehydrogenase family protein [Streptomyces sp. NPDC051064]|uniref:aldehyde dehydrogenase family protein n=1 Tax=Streptomyces sp. NPDC051064 TaxID=3365641 RepID=UPI003787EB63
MHGIDDIRAAVAQARSAGRGWAALGAPERRASLLLWKRERADHADEFTEVIAAETRKPVHDARALVPGDAYGRAFTRRRAAAPGSAWRTCAPARRRPARSSSRD